MTRTVETRGVGVVGDAREFVRRNRHAHGLLWTRYVNSPIGALLAFLFYPTRASPNMVSVTGVVVHVVAAAILAATVPPIAVPAAIAVVALWQLAFALDCADGQLARSRGQGSAFGAWLDQFMDVVTHSLVYGALCLFAARALDLDAAVSVALTALVFSLHLLQWAAQSQKASVIGRDAAVEPGGGGARIISGALSLVDYGLFLFVAGLLLLWPVALVYFLVASALVHGAAAVGQLALNWRRYLFETRRSGSSDDPRER